MEKLIFKNVENMPLPLRVFPDYTTPAENFSIHIHNPDNGILLEDESGDAYFAAYPEGKSNEMVTWGVVAAGEMLRGSMKQNYYTKAFKRYFNNNTKVYVNSPGQTKTEHWYLLYANTLAGVIYKTYFKHCENAHKRMLESASSMREMARNINYDFNDQGYDFSTGKSWTNKDIYRQPDSIGGYAYNMLFAGVHGNDDTFITEAVSAINLYEKFTDNPWYEIPNGSTAFFAAAWLKSKGYKVDLKKILGFIFDIKQGPLQIGTWNGEPVDGLMMGWRGDDREYAVSSAYSMETLMPLPFMLPAVKYVPETAKSIAWYALNAVSNFNLFFAKGLSNNIYETRPDLSNVVPYEKIEISRDGHSPAACGDFMGHRSVYGGAYMAWIAALMRPTEKTNIPAWDLTVTDWLDVSEKPEPVFMLYNNEKCEVDVSFTIGDIWKEKRPDLFENGHLKGKLFNFITDDFITNINDNQVRVKIAPESVILITLRI
ncbi:MAG: hypothetical protein FWE83_02190 [Oscillospiraceae bacterium]|nr:hypothetical protein [Oscillospiraceae bacterium]